jgi:DNA-binding transcriptional LysR family regulator
MIDDVFLSAVSDMLSLAHLKTFLTVCRLGSFTKAAHELNLTQPAVSGHIASLEDEVGMKLFDRTGKKIVLTDAGEVVQRSARSILSRIENMRNELEDLRISRGVTISVGASKLTGVYMMPGIFVAFRDRFPDLDMQIAVHAPHTIVGQLEENACDLAIVGEGETILPPSIGKMKIGEDRLTVIASPEHPLLKKQKLTLADAAGEDFILPGSRDASLQSFRASLKKTWHPFRRDE